MRIGLDPQAISHIDSPPPQEVQPSEVGVSETDTHHITVTQQEDDPMKLEVQVNTRPLPGRIASKGLFSRQSLAEAGVLLPQDAQLAQDYARSGRTIRPQDKHDYEDPIGKRAEQLRKNDGRIQQLH